MKKIIIIILFCFITINIMSQNNLILNSSFELYDTCPNYQAGIFLYYCNYWNAPNFGSSDYFNKCSLIDFSVPFNFYGGFHLPKYGFAYSGIYLIANSGSTISREYIQGALQDTLISGNTYIVRFYVALVDGSYCTDNIGAYFSDTVLHSTTNFSYIDVVPQFQNPAGNWITNTDKWQKIEGVFTASGGEKYISIGNFDPPSAVHYDNCFSSPLPISSAVTYIFIDDVSVIDTSLVDTIQLCVNDSVLLGGSYRNTEGLYIDTIQGLFVRSYLKPSTNPAYHIDVDLRFNGRDSVYVGYFWFDKSNMHSSDTTIVLNLPSVTGCDSMVYFHCRNNVGIEPTPNPSQEGNGIRVYPNPSSEFINLRIQQFENKSITELQVEIYDAVGRSIKYQVISSKTSNDNLEYKLNISELSKGIYFIKVTDKENRVIGNGRFICR